MTIKSLLVKIGADTSELSSALNTSGKQVGSFGSKFASLTGGIAAGLATFYAFKAAIGGITDFMGDSIKAAAAAEAADNSLRLALETTGREVVSNAQHLSDYAAELMGVTKHDDEAIKGAQTLLLQLTNLDRKGIDAATRGAIGLSSVLGIDLQGAAALVAKGMAGNTAALSRYGIKVSEHLPLAQKQIQLLSQLEAMFTRAKGEVGTFSGKIVQLKNYYGELKERIGFTIINCQGFRDILGAITEVMKQFADPSAKTSAAIRFIGMAAGVVADKLKSKFGIALAMLAADLQKSIYLANTAGISAEGFAQGWALFGKISPDVQKALQAGYLGLTKLWMAQNMSTRAARVDEEQMKKIIGTRQQLTDEIAKATMKEREYQRFAIATAYEERKAAIATEITDEKAKGSLLLQAAQSRDAQLAALEKSFRDTDLQARIDFAKEIADQEDQQTVDRIQNEKDYLAQKKQVTDAIKTIGMSQIASERYMIEQEALAKAQEIRDSKTLTEQQKKDLLAIWSLYYAQLIQKNYSAAQIMAAQWQAQMQKIVQWVSYFISGLSNLFAQATQNEQIRLDNEEKIKNEALKKEYTAKAATIDAENNKAVAAIEAEYAAKAEAIKKNVKDEKKKEQALVDLEKWRDTALQAQKNKNDAAMTTMEQEKADAEAKIAEELEKKKAALRREEARRQKAVALLSAIVNTASAIVEALPNIPLAIAIGIMGAAQVALIARQPLPLAEGAVVKRPTYAMIGERGPEAVIPLDRPGALAFAGAGAGATIRQSNYFYGNINNAGDLDEISRRLAERTIRAISKGRR